MILCPSVTSLATTMSPGRRSADSPPPVPATAMAANGSSRSPAARAAARRGPYPVATTRPTPGLARGPLAGASAAQPAPDRPGLEPQRSADQEPGSGHRAAPEPGAAHLEPGHGRAAWYRPSALTGKTSR